MLPDNADSTMFVDDDDDDDDGDDESGREYPDNFQAEDFCCDIELLPTVIRLFKNIGWKLRFL